jgi:hypothetical protein
MVKVWCQDKMQTIGCISSNLCTRLSPQGEREFLPSLRAFPTRGEGVYVFTDDISLKGKLTQSV